jgi:hypothetical protein
MKEESILARQVGSKNECWMTAWRRVAYLEGSIRLDRGLDSRLNESWEACDSHDFRVRVGVVTCLRQ